MQAEYEGRTGRFELSDGTIEKSITLRNLVNDTMVEDEIDLGDIGFSLESLQNFFDLIEYSDMDNNLNLEQLLEIASLVDYFNVPGLAPDLRTMSRSYLFRRITELLGYNIPDVSLDVLSNIGKSLILNKNFEGLLDLTRVINLSEIEDAIEFFQTKLWWFYPNPIPYAVLTNMGVEFPRRVWIGLSLHNYDSNRTFNTTFAKLQNYMTKEVANQFVSKLYRAHIDYLGKDSLEDVIQFGLLPDIERLFNVSYSADFLKYARSSVVNGFLDVYRFFKDHGVEGLTPLIKDDQTYYPLIMAAASGRYEIVKELVKYVNPNLSDSNGYTILNTGAIMGRTSIVKTAIDNNADPNLVTQDKTPMMWAASRGRANTERELMTYPEIVGGLNVTDESGNDVLMIAILNNRTDIVKVILGINDNDPIHIEGISGILTNFNKLGQTPLYLAVLRGNADIVKIILSFPEGISTLHVSQSPYPNVQSMDPLQLAVNNGYSNIINILSQYI